MSASNRKIRTAFNFNIAILKLMFSSLVSKSHWNKLFPAQNTERDKSQLQKHQLETQHWSVPWLCDAYYELLQMNLIE